MKMTGYDYQWDRFWAPSDYAAQDDDFLPPYLGLFKSDQIFTYKQIEDTPCLILLGNPGSGKTHTLQKIERDTKAQGNLCIFVKLNEISDSGQMFQQIINNPDFITWKTNDQHLFLFLDSLDEARLAIKRFDHDLKRFFTDHFVNNIHRLRLRITCRAADLPHDFCKEMSSLWNSKGVEKSVVGQFYLMQLQRADVESAATQRAEAGQPISPGEFMDSIHKAGIQALAAHPITLDMLFRIHEKKGNLPSTRTEAYELGCEQLASENSKSRVEDNDEIKYSAQERIGFAHRVATATVIGNKPKFISDPISHDYADDAVIFSEINDTENPISLGLCKETLRSSLFTSYSHGIYRWAHRSYGEYLAADFLNKIAMPLDKIKTLFVHPHDTYGKIAPKLQETAAWLANLRPEVFNWILEIDPLVLVRSKSIQLTDNQKASLIERFVKQYAELEINPDRLDWLEFTQLGYSKIGEQLVPYLQDDNNEDVRHLALNIIKACNVRTIDDDLIRFALDPSQLVYFRRSVLKVLSTPKTSNENLARLKAILTEPEKYQTTKEITASTVEVLYPEHLSTQEFFIYLDLSDYQQYIIGNPFDDLLSDDLVDNFSLGDLHIALEWVRNYDHSRDNNSVVGNNFIVCIMRKAWEYFEDEPTRVLFARAAWRRIMDFKGVFSDLHSFYTTHDEYIEELRSDADKRHKLLDAMLAVLHPEDLAPDSYYLVQFIVWNRHGICCYTEDDVFWLIEQAQYDVSDEQKFAYLYIAKHIVGSKMRSGSIDTNLSEWLFSVYRDSSNPMISAHLQDFFQFVKLDSDYAIAGRKSFEYRRRIAEIEANQLQDIALRREGIIEGLKKCENDSAHWWVVGHRYFYTWINQEIDKSEGWRIIQNDIDVVLKTLNVMLQYVHEQHPYIGDVDPSIPIAHRPPAIEGYKVFILLTKLNGFEKLESDDWQRWADAIAFNPYDTDKETELIDETLLKKLFETAAGQLIERFREIIELGREETHVQRFLSRFRYAPADMLNKMLLAVLSKLSIEGTQFHIILDYLLRQNSAVSSEAQRIGQTYLVSRSSDESTQRSQIKIITSFASSASNNDWWADTKKLLKDEIFVAKVLPGIGEIRNTPFLRYLSESELYELYVLVESIYRVEHDIAVYGGIVSERENRQEWRNSILNHIADRGTQQAIQMLKNLKINRPSIPGINLIIEKALQRFVEISWSAPSTELIMQFVAHSRSRSPRNADQLLDLVLQTLQVIQQDYRGDNVKQSALWNDQTIDKTSLPVDEERFTAALQSWLSDKLSSVIINTEARPNIFYKSEQRTDIQIEMISDSGDRIMIIIEVKCCWYDGIYKQIQMQLVNQYLARHPISSHGIYLVGYFASASDKWNTEDGRKGKCGKDSKEEILQKLEQGIEAIQQPTHKKVIVKPFVFDASI